MSNLKTCKDCKQEKNKSEFYEHKNRNYESYHPYCKACHQKRNNRYQENGHTSPEHETNLVNYLRGRRISADNGKYENKTPFVDVVALGCVNIEVKNMINYRSRSYIGRITDKQRKIGFTAHVVALLMDDEFYFFRPDFPKFYNGGKLKSAICYTRDSRAPHISKVAMSKSDFDMAHNRISLIRSAYDLLVDGKPVYVAPPKPVVLPKPKKTGAVQLTLFDLSSDSA